MKHVKMIAVLAATALAAPANAAGLIGTPVTVTYDFLGVPQTDVVTANGGTSITCPGAFNVCNYLTASNQYIGFGANSINYSYVGSGSGFNDVSPSGFIFSGLNPGFAITGINLITDIPTLTQSRVSFTANTVSVDMHGLPLPGNRSFSISLTGNAVPEPAEWALMLGGFALTGGAMRRRRAARVITA